MGLDVRRFADQYRAQEEVVFVPDALPAERVAVLRAEALRLAPEAVRVHVPFMRRAGTTGGRRILGASPAIAELYRELRDAVSALVGIQLFVKDPDDDQSMALFSYREGDFMSPHFDRCGDSSGAYSVTIGLVDESTSRLECSTASAQRFSYATGPGSLTIFNGSTVWHGVTRLGRGERRIVLSAAFRTAPDPNACAGWQQTALELGEYYMYFGVRGLRRPRRRGVR